MFIHLIRGSAERQRRYRAKRKAATLTVELWREPSMNEICDLAGRLHDGVASRQDELTAAALIAALMRKLEPAVSLH